MARRTGWWGPGRRSCAHLCRTQASWSRARAPRLAYPRTTSPLEPAISRPVVFVHGTRTSSAIWVRQAAALTSLGHQTVAIDLPGHGARTAERFTLDAALQTIGAAVRECDHPPLLAGLSLGGYLSLAWAGRHRDRIAGLMLSGCSAQPQGRPLATYRVLSTAANGALGVGGATWEVVADMLAALTGYSMLDDLARVRSPLWIVNGQRDPLRIDERRCLRVAPRARLTVVARAGHDVNTDAPVAYNRVLLGAVTELSPDQRPGSVAHLDQRAHLDE